MFNHFPHFYDNLSTGAKPVFLLLSIQLLGFSLDAVQHFVESYNVLIDFLFKFVGLLCSVIILFKTKKKHDDA